MNAHTIKLQVIHNKLTQPDLLEWSFWGWPKWDSWTSIAVGVLGLYISYLAYLEAKKAKEAAQRAANTVKAVTVTLELMDIVHKIERLDVYIQYPACWDLVNESTRKINRLIAPFRDEKDLSVLIYDVEGDLQKLRAAINGVVPIGSGTTGSTYTVFIAVQMPFSSLLGHLGELVGIFEKRSTVI